MKTIKNIAFGLSGGWVISLYFISMAIVYALSIIGIKKAYTLLKCAAFCLMPYGKNAYTDFMSHKIGNSFWAVTTGWQAALICLIFAGIWCVTIFGLYLGARYFHLAQYVISPFGAKWYPTDLLTGDETAIVKLRNQRRFEL